MASLGGWLCAAIDGWMKFINVVRSTRTFEDCPVFLAPRKALSSVSRRFHVKICRPLRATLRRGDGGRCTSIPELKRHRWGKMRTGVVISGVTFLHSEFQIPRLWAAVGTSVSEHETTDSCGYDCVARDSENKTQPSDRRSRSALVESPIPELGLVSFLPGSGLGFAMYDRTKPDIPSIERQYATEKLAISNPFRL